MTLPFTPPALRAAFEALRRDLIHEGGPRISTMRNYRFAILQYEEHLEFEVRQQVQRLTGDLEASGWSVRSIDLLKLLLDRIRAQGPGWTERITEMERNTSRIGPERGLNYLKSKLTPLIEGPEGIAADCSRIIAELVERHPQRADRTLALIGRAGSLYPFFRSSALLRHLDGRTGSVPVVILYPGRLHPPTGLSFMGLLPPDSDYRPRIYS
jgi:hypothetical protein